VRLFNAVAKSQKQQEEATLSGAKPAQVPTLVIRQFILSGFSCHPSVDCVLVLGKSIS
jgi:hypothetical protein